MKVGFPRQARFLNHPSSLGTRGSEATDAVDDYLQAVMEKNQVPGVALAIVREGKVERLSAYGLADLESEAKVVPESSFQIASATKVFTGTLVMILVQEGKIDLDAPVSKYLPDAPESWRGMTVRHLAAHASGLKDLPDEDEATVKRYFLEGNRIRFQPANAAMQPIYVNKADFRSTMLLGIVVGVYRKLPGSRS